MAPYLESISYSDSLTWCDITQPKPRVGISQVSVFADVDSKCLRGFAKKFEAGRKIFVGNGVLALPREELFKGSGVKSGLAVRMTDPAFDCPSLNEAASGGSFMLQVPNSRPVK